MSLVPSLLQAIVHVDGEALVMHAGDKPYVVSPTGQVDLASRGLTLDAVSGIVDQLLPIEFQRALDEFGAVQYELPPQAEFPRERFTVVAARGGDDVWAEIRRRKVSDDDMVPEELFGPASSNPARAPEPIDPAEFEHASGRGSGTVEVPAVYASSEQDNDSVDFDEIAGSPPVATGGMPWKAPDESRDAALALPDALSLWPDRGHHAVSPDADVLRADTHDDGLSFDEDVPAPPVAAAPPPPPPPPIVPAVPVREAAVVPSVPVAAAPSPHAVPPPAAPAPPIVKARPPVAVPPPAVAPPFVAAPPPVLVKPPIVHAPAAKAPSAPLPVMPPPVVPSPVVHPPVMQQPVMQQPPPVRPAPPPPAPPPTPGVVLTMSRNPIRADLPPAPPAGDTLSGLERLLRTAASRGARTLYLSSDARPSVRVDGQLQILDSEPLLTSNDVVSLLLTLMPDRSHEALRTGATTEWITDIEDIGRVRCMSFRDHRGPGGVFRLMPVRAVSSDQLGLTREIQALAIEPEGLVLVSGPRSSGKRTLMSALVDLINQTRRDHVITIEREVNIVHTGGNSFVSQREVRGSDDDVLAAARSALREDPDVLVLEQVRTGALMNVALEAAASGHLVIAGFSAHNATETIDRIIDLYAPEFARQVQLALADNLRGVVTQVLLPKTSGGRVAAREILLNTPAVAGVIAEGTTSQLPMAIEGGRRHGMVPLHDSLVAFVQSGAVDVREAYRYVTDRPAFIALLKRQGIDTSFAERLA